MEMKKIIEVNDLLDIYGDLLTEKQNEVMRLYYEEDLSLGEISKFLNISRQAVYDTVKKSEIALQTYEDNLKIRNNSKKIDKFKEQLVNLLQKFEKDYKENLDDKQTSDIKQIIKFCKESEI